MIKGASWLISFHFAGIKPDQVLANILSGRYPKAFALGYCHAARDQQYFLKKFLCRENLRDKCRAAELLESKFISYMGNDFYGKSSNKEKSWHIKKKNYA